MHKLQTQFLAVAIAIGCSACGAPTSGVDTLIARGVAENQSFISFEHATVDPKVVNTDWDMEFGNDQDPQGDDFSVKLEVLDESYIVDLGAIALADVPEMFRESDYPVGRFGEHDNVPTVLNHVYLVRTLDRDSKSFTAFRVTDWKLNESVTIEWHRSTDADRFVMPK